MFEVLGLWKHEAMRTGPMLPQVIKCGTTSLLTENYGMQKLAVGSPKLSRSLYTPTKPYIYILYPYTSPLVDPTSGEQGTPNGNLLVTSYAALDLEN